MPRRKTESLERVLHALLAQGAIDGTYKNLSEVAFLSKRTVASSIAELRELDYVRTAPAALGDGFGLVLSVALGTETCRAGLVDANGEIHARYEAPLQRSQIKLPPRELLGRVALAVEGVQRKAHGEPHLARDGKLPLLGLSTAWACPVRGSGRAAGTVLHLDWASESRTLSEAVADETGFPRDRVHALNDANAHLLAVAFMEGRRRAMLADEKNPRIALLLRIGGGIGASTMIMAPHRRNRLAFIDSSLLGGARSLAGELAHLPVESSIVRELNNQGRWIDGLAPLSLGWRCSCGQPGHLEALAGGAAWELRMKESGIEVDSLLEGLDMFTTEEIDREIAQFDDRRVTHALEDIGRLIGRSLASPILLLDPHALFLTGSYVVAPVIAGVMAEREAWRHVFDDGLTIEPARDADSRFLGVRGAGLAVLRSHVYRRFGDWLQSDELRRKLIFNP